MKITLTDQEVKQALMAYVNTRLLGNVDAVVTFFVGTPEDGYESSITAVLETRDIPR